MNPFSGEALRAAAPPAPESGGQGVAGDPLPRAVWLTQGPVANSLRLLLLAGVLASVTYGFLNLMRAEYWAARTEALVDLAAEVRTLTQEQLRLSTAVVRGQAGALEGLTAHRDQLDALIGGLPGLIRHGRDPLRPAAEGTATVLTPLLESWRDLRAAVDNLLTASDDLIWFREVAATSGQRLADLAGASARVAEALVAANAAPGAVLEAALQSQRVQAIAALAAQMAQGDSVALGGLGIESVGSEEYARALASLDASAVATGQAGPGSRLRLALDEARRLLGQVNEDGAALAVLSQGVVPALAASEQVAVRGAALDQALTRLLRDLREQSARQALFGMPAGIAGVRLSAALSLLFLGLLSLQQLVSARRREAASRAQNRAHQAAIQRLLAEIRELADGDLTVVATVTSGPTGAIAESLNHAVLALRELVLTIRNTAGKVSESALSTRTAATSLASGSAEQATRIEQASGAITAMTSAIDEIARSAAESAGVASRAVLVAGRGAAAVRDTVDGMGAIRTRIDQTAKRIRRLGEGSQEIGEIVELIDDIADQTNILALNAAMQAAIAGEAGRGFAVVADEVQRLAERSGNATKQIEGIVRSIRADTSEAMRLMDGSLTDVAAGVRVAENAGHALREIESVSASIAEMTRRIADSADNESRAAAQMVETVRAILATTRENARGTRTAAALVDVLARLAQELETSVAGFRLPAGAGTKETPVPGGR